MPLVPEQSGEGRLFGAAAERDFASGLDARWIGSQFLRGDEGNEQEQLDPYFVLGARAGLSYRAVGLLCRRDESVEQSRPGVRHLQREWRTGELERFLTPLNARTFNFIIRRSFGNRGSDNDN